MRFFIAFIIVIAPWISAGAAPAMPVQKALKLLPPERAKNLVRIEAREGTPMPERWYIQVYDPNEESGLHEFVVSQKEIVASRSLSQFLSGAKSEDVVAIKVVKVDSDDLIKLAEQYAAANHLEIAKISYTLARDPSPPPNPNGATPVPLWTLTCYDESGGKPATLVINSRNGSVVSHDGFALAPGQSAKTAAAAPAPSASPQPEGTIVKAAQPVEPAAPAPGTVPVKTAQAVTPAASATPKPKGGLFQRMFHGKPTPTPTVAPTPPRR
jgi:hypothetical protein